MFNPNEHMMKLKGKDYLQVMWRLVWFREDHPDWSINPSALEYDADHAIFKAEICDENGVLKCSAHGSESKRDFGDYLEKAETKAVGRALAMLGYGTQFTATELDEGERIVDSPVDREPRGSAEAAQEAGRKKLEELNRKAEEAAKNSPSARQAATPEQIALIKDIASDEDYLKIMQKYGPDMEKLTANTAAKVIAELEKRNNSKIRRTNNSYEGGDIANMHRDMMADIDYYDEMH